MVESTIKKEKEKEKSPSNQDKEEKDELDEFFDDFLKSSTIKFKHRNALSSSYVPDRLPHRKEQIKNLGMSLATALKGGTPSNIFIYGKPGTGKTVVTKYVLEKIREKATKVGFQIKYSFTNSKTFNTPYRVFADLCAVIGVEVPATGLPTNEVFARFCVGLENLQDSVLFIIVLDEVDELVKKSGSEILYNLTRINTQLKNETKASIIGISNDTTFKDYLDPRVFSSLSEEELVFIPYKANEIVDILAARAKEAFEDTSCLKSGVVQRIAAIAASEHGDARRAIDLLRVSTEIAERHGKEIIDEECVQMALNQIEKNTVFEVANSLPLQSLMVLCAIYLLSKQENITTGAVFDKYISICNTMGMDVLSQRRVSDLVNELDVLGIVNAKVVSKGRYGRTKKIQLSIPKNIIKIILANNRFLSSFVEEDH
ncbi:MAG: Cdc6/Cdc18 family protein [Candidatus Hodarchaeales archaeon]